MWGCLPVCVRDCVCEKRSFSVVIVLAAVSSQACILTRWRPAPSASQHWLAEVHRCHPASCVITSGRVQQDLSKHVHSAAQSSWANHQAVWRLSVKPVFPTHWNTVLFPQLLLWDFSLPLHCKQELVCNTASTSCGCEMCAHSCQSSRFFHWQRNVTFLSLTST